ncbi:MAG: gliding motility protein GldC [Chitinophagaceae bacterium]|nr:MAG: gliding motility protein GldC [Chitinophagaceae bacterium]
MHKSTITIDILLDPNKIPEQINWKASDTSTEDMQRAKALCLALWDGVEKNALRIDLWTKDMMVDEMGDFYFQMLMSLADTFKRATRQEKLGEDMKTFAKEFINRFREELSKDTPTPNL